ncbi:MAG: hypothetical protein ABI690_20160 [Chloroflexota bacterium]
MASKQYDFKTLVQTYIETKRKYHLHEDFKNYYARLLKHLEAIFKVEISPDKSRDKALWMLFDATIRSYLQITHPWNYFLEDTLINARLEQQGERGEQIFALSNRLGELNDESKELHLQMLYDLFEIMFGKVDKVLTSKELKTGGFDDSTEPHTWDAKYDNLR